MDVLQPQNDLGSQSLIMAGRRNIFASKKQSKSNSAQSKVENVIDEIDPEIQELQNNGQIVLLNHKPAHICRHQQIKDYLETPNPKKQLELAGFETFTFQIGDMILNSLTYAIYKRNINALKYLVEEYKLNIASSISIQQDLKGEDGLLSSQQSLYEEVLQCLDPIFTLKMALDTGDLEIFEYVLDFGCQFFSLDSAKLEEFMLIIH